MSRYWTSPSIRERPFATGLRWACMAYVVLLCFFLMTGIGGADSPTPTYSYRVAFWMSTPWYYRPWIGYFIERGLFVFIVLILCSVWMDYSYLKKHNA